MYRVTYKLATLTFNIKRSRQPSYLQDYQDKSLPIRKSLHYCSDFLHSASHDLLASTPTCPRSVASRACRHFAAHTWNSIPFCIRSCDTIITFKRRLFHPYWLIKKAIFPKTTQKSWSVSHLLHFYITVTLTKSTDWEPRGDSKSAIHITHNLTRGMPYSSMLYCVNLNSLAFRRDVSRDFFHNILDPASCLHSLLPPPRSTAITSRLRSSQTFPKVHTRTQRYSYNMVLIITSKPNCSTIVGLIAS